MPINSFLNNAFEDNPFGGLPRIAKLHKGSKKRTRTNKKGETYEIFGEDLDYLRVEFTPEYEYLRPVWEEMFGAKPTALQVMFNAETVDQALDFWKEEWTASTMLHRCDERQQHIWYDGRTGHYMRAKIACIAPQCQCKSIARLNFIIPAFTLQTGVLGYITIETTSQEDIRTLIARLSSFWATFGRLRGIPFVLYRQTRKTSAPEMSKDGKQRTGKRLKVPRSMLDIRVEPEYSQQYLLQALTGERPALPAPTAHSGADDAEPSTAQARNSLGSGGKRRIGNESDSTPTTTNSNGKQSEPETRWVNDKKRVAEFKKWALSDFIETEADLIEALSFAAEDYEVEAITDWRGDERTSIAAVIAYYCDYDPAQIDETTVLRKMSIETRDVAIAIAERVNQRAEAPDESEQAGVPGCRIPDR